MQIFKVFWEFHQRACIRTIKLEGRGTGFQENLRASLREVRGESLASLSLNDCVAGHDNKMMR